MKSVRLPKLVTLPKTVNGLCAPSYFCLQKEIKKEDKHVKQEVKYTSYEQEYNPDWPKPPNCS